MMRPLRTHLIRAGSLSLLALGVALHDPYLVPVRAWLPAAISIVAAVVTGLLARCKGDRIALFLWTATLLLPPGEALIRANCRERVLMQSGDAAALGRHFLVGYTRMEEIAPLAARGLIGGIFIGNREGDGDELKWKIASLQALRKVNGLPPLLVATDQEGGLVSRLSPPLLRRQPLSSFAKLPPGERATASRLYGLNQGAELASLGVTVNFAPVFDLKRDPPRWDRSSFIAERAISDDPAVVGEIATAYARGLREAGIVPTAKHFPGLGRAKGDTHHVRVRLTTRVEDLEASDWRPFQQMLEDGPVLLMVGHAILDGVDPEEPASSSRPVIQGLIRGKWGFDGVVVTDDLTMPSFFHHDFCRGVVRALDAGADLLLISYDTEQYYHAFECALDGLRDGRLDRTMLETSNLRLARLS